MNPPEPPADAPTTPPSLLSCITDIVAAPGELLDRLKPASPSTGRWLVPVFLFILTGWVGATLLFSQEWTWQQIRDMQDAAIEKSMKSKGMSPEQMEQAKAGAEKITRIATRVGGYAGPVVLGFGVVGLYGLYIWLVGNKALGASFPIAKSMELTGLTLVIDALAGVVKTLLILVTGNLMASASPAILLHPFDSANPVHGALAQLDLFAFWALALKSMVLSRLSGRPFGISASWVCGLWLVLHGFIIAASFLGQMLSQR